MDTVYPLKIDVHPLAIYESQVFFVDHAEPMMHSLAMFS